MRRLQRQTQGALKAARALERATSRLAEENGAPRYIGPPSREEDMEGILNALVEWLEQGLGGWLAEHFEELSNQREALHHREEELRTLELRCRRAS